MTIHVRFDHVTVRYGAKTALNDVSLEIPEKQILASSARPIPARRRC